MGQAWSIVLGAVLAIITGLIAEYVRLRIARNRSRGRFRRMLRVELPEIAGILERLIADANRAGGVIAFVRLDELAAAADRHLEWPAGFKDTAARRDVYNLLRELNLTAANARAVEGVANRCIGRNDPTASALVANRRRELLEEFRALSAHARRWEHLADELR